MKATMAILLAAVLCGADAARADEVVLAFRDDVTAEQRAAIEAHFAGLPVVVETHQQGASGKAWTVLRIDMRDPAMRLNRRVVSKRAFDRLFGGMAPEQRIVALTAADFKDAAKKHKLEKKP